MYAALATQFWVFSTLAMQQVAYTVNPCYSITDAALVVAPSRKHSETLSKHSKAAS